MIATGVKSAIHQSLVLAIFQGFSASFHETLKRQAVWFLVFETLVCDHSNQVKCFFYRAVLAAYGNVVLVGSTKCYVCG